LSDELSIRVITRAQLRDPEYWTEWTWPDEIPPIGGMNRDFVLHHPLAVGEDDPVQILAVTGSQVVGRVNLINGRLQVDSQDVDVLWGSGLAVPERFRHTGAGLMLMLRMAGAHHTTCVVGISRIVAPIYEKLRWVAFPMARYVLLRHSSPVLEPLIGSAGTRVAKRAIDPLLSMHASLLRTWIQTRARGFVVERRESLPADLDARLAAARVSVTCYRSSAWINWLLGHRREARQLCIVHDKSGHMLGYFIYTSRFHESASDGRFRNLMLGSIKEWMVVDPERISDFELLLLATRELFLDDRLDAIEVCLPDEALGPSLRRLGFMRKGDLKLLFKAGPKSPLAHEKYRNRSAWWFRPADGDNFFF